MVSSQRGQGQPFYTPKWPLMVNAVWSDGQANLCEKGLGHCSLLSVHMYVVFTCSLSLARRYVKQSPRR